MRLLLILLALGLAPISASAQTFDVKQLDVKQGSLEVGLDNTWQAGSVRDGNRRAHDQSLDYGVSNWWRLSGVIKVEDPHRDDARVARAAVESIWVLRQVPKDGGIGFGWFASLEASTDPATAHASLFGPIIVAQSGKVSFTANPFFEMTFGRHREEGVALSYGWNAKYQLSETFALGVEGFGLVKDLGSSPRLSEQEHRIGPAVFTTINLRDDLTITPDLGLFFGLTDGTPDITLKLNVGIPLR